MKVLDDRTQSSAVTLIGFWIPEERIVIRSVGHSFDYQLERLADLEKE